MSDRWRHLLDEIREFFGGGTPYADSILPPVAFVALNAWRSVETAAIGALAVAVGILLYRIFTGGAVTYAVSGIIGVGIAAFIAVRLGRAEGFFLPGIVSAASMSLIAILTIVARRPLVAWSSWAIRQWPREWYWRPDVRPAYTEATVAWAAFFALRAGVQYRLFADENVELLAAARIVMGLPAFAALLIATYFYGTWRLERLGGPTAAEFANGTDPPYSGHHRRF